jgi:hypothetical protein
MSDERLLSEALRAQAAGGVSTPRADPSAPPAGPPATDAGSDGPSASGRRRFRPLGRVRHPEQPELNRPDQTSADQPRTGQSRTEQSHTEQQRTEQSRTEQSRTEHPAPERAPRPDVPSPRSGAPGLPPPGYARGPMLPGPPTVPVRPGPTSGGFGAAGPVRAPGRPGGPHPTPPSTGASAGYVPWSAVTVTWWTLVAILAGGVIGGAIGVLSLLLPG